MRNRKRILYAVLVIVWMGVIFFFSSQNGEESSGLSDTIVRAVIELFCPSFDGMPAGEQQHILESVSFIVRKTAHFTEYAILAVLCMLFTLTYEGVHWKTAAGAVLFCALYAVTDEFHQGFVADRSPQLRDVCIDTAGALMGALAVLAGLRFTRRRV